MRAERCIEYCRCCCECIARYSAFRIHKKNILKGMLELPNQIIRNKKVFHLTFYFCFCLADKKNLNKLNVARFREEYCKYFCGLI